jgi:hydrogenase maturation protease
MSDEVLEEIINAVLYEGFILYPYRPSSRKNQRERFTFGRVYPQRYSIAERGAESCRMQTECLLSSSSESPVLTISVRFLHPLTREIAVLDPPMVSWDGSEPSFRVVPELRLGEKLFQTWQEATERRIEVPPLDLDRGNYRRQRMGFEFPSSRALEPIYHNRQVVGMVVREQAAVRGNVEVTAERLTPTLLKITVAVLNQSELPESELGNSDKVLLRTFASTNTVLRVSGGQFISLLDSGPEFEAPADLCRNIGTWPVLVGDEEKAQRDTMLSSPIILYDYPQIARESAGSLYDGSEIDELLTLRIKTLTEEEKLEMRNTDEHARNLLERTEALTEADLLQMHGAMRRPITGTNIDFDDFFGANTPLTDVSVGGVHLKPGDQVRIRPKGRSDVLDIALSGQRATIEAIEQDLERRIHLALVLENDPGKDLGLLRQPGHRFFFGADEVEPISAMEHDKSSVVT